MDSFVLPPRLTLATLPTRIEPLYRAGEGGEGPTLFVKRDDDTGGVVSGNKIRKLQYVVRAALDEGADTLITCGGVQSNHCRATAAVGARLGLDVQLLLRGTGEEAKTGNLFLDRVLGATLHFITPDAYREHDAAMEHLAQTLRARGRRPFVIAEGASMASGSPGYMEACQEIAAHESEHHLRFAAIVHAVGSGGTCAGLALGAWACNLTARVIGVPVCDDAAYFRPLINRIMGESVELLGLPSAARDAPYELMDGFAGLGYGKTTAAERAALLALARSTGVVLDPVYGLKAYLGVRNLVESGAFAPSDNILFVHTGGVYGLLAQASAFAD